MLRFQLYDATEQKEHSINESDTLDQLCEDLEYGDVAEGIYTVLDTTNERQYVIIPDRAVGKNDYYATPFNSKGTVWLPKLGGELGGEGVDNEE